MIEICEIVRYAMNIFFSDFVIFIIISNKLYNLLENYGLKYCPRFEQDKCHIDFLSDNSYCSKMM